MILLFTGRENDLENPGTKTFCLSDLENLCTFSGSLDEYLIKSFCLYRFSRPHYLIVGRHFSPFAPRAFRQLDTVHSEHFCIRLELFSFGCVFTRNTFFVSRTPTFGLELPRSAFVLELSRSASNSHVRLRPRTLTFGLELPRSAVSSNSHVRPRTLTFGCVLELPRSASKSNNRLCHKLLLCTL